MSSKTHTLISDREYQALIRHARKYLDAHPTVSVSHLTRAMEGLLLTGRRAQPLTEIQQRRLTLYQDGMSVCAIAKLEGRTHHTIYETLAYAGVDRFAKHLKHARRVRTKRPSAQ